MRKIFIVASIVLVSSSNCRTQSQQVQSLDAVQPVQSLDAVIDAVARRDFTQAQAEASTVIRLSQSTEQRRQALFYRALAAQNLAEQASNDARRALYLAAATDYETALTFDPRAGGVLNNLARVYAALNDPRAASVFRRACDLQDNPDRALYLKNFAAYELTQGHVEEARRLERAAADLAGGDRDAQQQLIQLHLGAETDSFVPYVQQLIDSGATTAAEDAIIGALDNVHLTLDQASEFAILLSRALVRDKYDPTKWPDLKIAKQIGRIANSNAPVAPAMAEIAMLHARPVVPITRFPWWRDGEPSARRRDAFSRLAHRLGAWYAQSLDFETARWYMQLAVDLVDNQQSRIDYLVDLAEVLYAANDVPSIRQLARQYDAAVPRVTITTPRDEAMTLYGYHRTMGLILDEFHVGGPQSATDAAPYHLTAMLAAAQRYGRDGDRILPVDPVVVQALTTYLEQQAEPGAVLQARIQAAETYLLQGETTLAMNVVRETSATAIAAADRRAANDFTRISQNLGLRPLPSNEPRLAEVNHRWYKE